LRGKHLLSPVEPGKYDFLDCPSIAKQLAATSYEEAKLARLMTRASEAADGAFVNAIVHQDQYNTARARLRELRKVGEVKKCSPSDLNPPPTAPPENWSAGKSTRDGICLSDHLAMTDGNTIFRHVAAMGLEGIDKRRDRPYRSGGPLGSALTSEAPSWLAALVLRLSVAFLH
jgi:hypothetical protein